MSRYFITATGTEIGKTFVTAALAHRLHTTGRSLRVLKPVASGYDPGDPSGSDTAILQRAAGLPPDAIDLVSPWRFRAPLSPDMAAAREGRGIDFEALIRFCETGLQSPAEAVLIEGVGGLMVPLDGQHTVLDWMQRLAIPAIVVAGTYLGTISHTLTAMRVLESAGVSVHALVLDETAGSSVLMTDTAAVLERFLPRTRILPLPYRAGTDAWRNASELWPLLP